MVSPALFQKREERNRNETKARKLATSNLQSTSTNLPMIHLPKILQPSQPNQILSQFHQLSIRRRSVRPCSFERLDLESFARVESKVSGEIIDVDGVGGAELREFVPEELETGGGGRGGRGREGKGREG